MLNTLLSSEQTRFAAFGEVGVYALIGFIVVFVGIAFLIGVVWLVGKLMSKTSKQPSKEKPAEAVKVEPSAESVPSVAEDELSDEVIAVITAAIMAYYEKNNPKCDFVVKRIKRI